MSKNEERLGRLKNQPLDVLYRMLETSSEGLSQGEASRRLRRFGSNEIPEQDGKRRMDEFFANFTHLMACLLWIAAAIAFLTDSVPLGVAIVLINVINGLFSFFQESRAEKATQALRRLLPQFARALRDGKEKRVRAEELVPGDLVLLAEGDRVSADGILVQEIGLSLDQSTLTGESEPVRKKAGPSEEGENLLFAGTHAVAGSGRFLVAATGAQTEFGFIAGLAQGLKAPSSPLQKELDRVAKTVTLLAVGIGALFFAPAFLLVGVTPYESFVFALGMIISFVPEGMPPTVTLALAMGVQRMAQRKALIKRLSSIETLGSTTVICTDKTGTLTENRMSVESVWPCSDLLEEVLLAGALCNDARLLENGEIVGSPTEAAILRAALEKGLDPVRAKRERPRLREIPFDTQRKRMTTIHREGEAFVAFVKGSPLEVLSRCDFPQDERKGAIAAIDEGASRGLRMLAVARKNLPSSEGPQEEIEQGLTFLGLIALLDPPREGVAEAIARCHEAGIRILMLTGDYERTAEGIARRIGLAEDGKVLSGALVDAMSDEQLKEALLETSVFARMVPECKLRIVRLLQEMGQVVAVTGDGVNDAPALKKADIGIAMGASGTDVARSAADMILIDDHFASIVNAIEEGRAIYGNIRRFAVYLFTANLAEALPFVLMLFSRGLIPLPLTMMQSLAIDLGSNMLPSIGLGAERAQAAAMAHPPRPKEERLLDRGALVHALLWYGLLEAGVSLSAYFFLNWRYGWPHHPLAPRGSSVYRMATTMTFAGIALSQAGIAFACRTDSRSVFSLGLFSNRLISWGVILSILLVFTISEIPLFQGIFDAAPLGMLDWGLLILYPPSLLLLDEARKLVKRRREDAL